MDGGCTGEGNIGKHGYLFEKMCHTPELDEHETYETLALKQPGWPASQCLNQCVWRQQESTVQLLDLEMSGLDGHV